jgi:hypothetical protein
MKERLEMDLKMIKQILCGIFVVLIAGWVTYVSAKGISIDTMVAGINTRVTVLETVALNIKEDIIEIKMLMREVRQDQKRRETLGR